MNELELEIFEQSSDYWELRLRGGERPRTRGLDQAAIDRLIEVVEHAYAEDSIAQRVFGSAALRELGEKLFNFLDGDERWFSKALADPRGCHGADRGRAAAGSSSLGAGRPGRLVPCGQRERSATPGAGCEHNRDPRHGDRAAQPPAARAVHGERTPGQAANPGHYLYPEVVRLDVR